MVGGLLRRLLLALPTLFGVTLVTFLVVVSAPGDPARLDLPPGLDRARAEARLKTFLDLDRPLPARYLSWLGRAATLDFGDSFADGERVAAKLASALPPTLILGGASLLLGFLLAVPLGTLCAGRAGGPLDRSVSALLLALYSLPPWILGLLLILVFGVWLPWLPFQGWRSPGWEGLGPAGRAADIASHAALILAATVLPGLAHDARFVRQAVREELGQPYVAWLRSLGFTEGRILWRHALRNALVPILTLAGLSLPGLLAGSVLLEQMFGWPGLGRLFFLALERRDHPVILAVATLGAFLVVAGTLLADLLCLLADPRLADGRR